MVRALALVTSLVLAGPISASAQAADSAGATAEEDVYTRNGFYIGASFAGVTFPRIADEVARQVGNLTSSAVSGDAEAAVGLNARVGYRLHPRVAGEVQFEWLSSSDISLTGAIDQSSAFETQSWVVSANAKGYVLTGSLQPYLLLGAGVMRSDLDDNENFGFEVDEYGFVGRLGGGLEYYFTPRLVATVDVTYVLPADKLAEFEYISAGLGLQYRF